MSPTRYAPYVAACKGKVAIANFAAAERAAANSREAHGNPVVSYRCKFCGHFHTGDPIPGQSIHHRIREPRVRPDPAVAHPNRLARRK